MGKTRPFAPRTSDSNVAARGATTAEIAGDLELVYRLVCSGGGFGAALDSAVAKRPAWS